jgi:PhzF family phenazine biosynthesis protein
MKIPMFQVDAFTEKIFGGNPAAVCPLATWLPTETMQAIAAENNLAETAFYVKDKNRFEIRWFTPAIEINLCGHATLASAHVIFHHQGHTGPRISFSSKSGELRAIKQDDLIHLDFPAYDAVPVAEVPGALIRGLGKKPRELFKGRDFLAVFEKEEDILSLAPDFAELAALDCLGIIATAKGERCDFVSRFFAPRAGVPEDPVTGSSHTLLIPFWAKRLGKNILRAVQLSKRRGELFCEYRGERVFIGGRAVTFFQGTIEI